MEDSTTILLLRRLFFFAKPIADNRKVSLKFPIGYLQRVRTIFIGDSTKARTYNSDVGVGNWLFGGLIYYESLN